MRAIALVLVLASVACGGGEPVPDSTPTESVAVEEPAKTDCPCGEPDLDTPPPPAPDAVQNVPVSPDTTQ